MFVGILQFELVIRGADSLKDKRRVVRSVKDRLHREHQVSVAEVGALDHHRLALMGAAVVANSERRAHQVLDHIVEKLRALHDAELAATAREVLRGDQPPAAEPGVDLAPDSDPAWTDADTAAMLGEAASAPERGGAA